jgi:hypothetical protein
LAALSSPQFLIVGTPRSGTTLVQRVVSDFEGVRVPPETHFFSEFATAQAGTWTFPLAGDRLRGVLRTYRDRGYLSDVPLDVDAVVATLGDRCDTPVDLYGAIVGELAGDAVCVGEKTPAHLLWWRPLTRALPHLKLICVIRDPRAVVASFARAGWSHHPVATAVRWNDDVGRVEAARRALGAERCLVLRYEDLVGDVGSASDVLATFLAVDGQSADGGEGAPGQAQLFAGWETWKSAALGPVDPGRRDAWRDQLPVRTRRAVAAICHRGMRRHGYDPETGRIGAIWGQARLSPAWQFWRWRQVVRRWRRNAEIARISASWPSPDDEAAGLTTPGTVLRSQAPEGRERGLGRGARDNEVGRRA